MTTPPKPSERDQAAKQWSFNLTYQHAFKGGWDAGTASERKRCEEMLEIAVRKAEAEVWEMARYHMNTLRDSKTLADDFASVCMAEQAAALKAT